jgi:acetyl-CoA C-acetyltransferase
MAAGMLFAGSAGLVIAGGLEAWSRAPLRQHRPLTATQAPVHYERPAFAPDPARDPDLLLAAAAHALSAGLRRERQDAHARDSHQRAFAARAQLSDEITPIGVADHDSHVRTLSAEKIRRLPVVAMTGHDASSAEQAGLAAAHAVSMLAVSPRADGAAFVVLASEETALSLGVKAQFRWHTGVSIGAAPERPMLATITATELALQRCGLHAQALWGVELHDAFAAQALAFLDHFSLDPARLNRRGGGLARGHPIGASGAISLVRLLNDMARDAPVGAFGATSIAGAGGLGAAAIVERL